MTFGIANETRRGFTHSPGLPRIGYPELGRIEIHFHPSWSIHRPGTPTGGPSWTIGGAGVLHGDLTAGCAAAVAAVLDALSAPAGKEDDRTKGQRYHDALAEAMRQLRKCIVI